MKNVLFYLLFIFLFSPTQAEDIVSDKSIGMELARDITRRPGFTLYAENRRAKSQHDRYGLSRQR